MICDLIFMDILKIKSQIKSPYFNVILKISKSSKNNLKSDFVKSSIKSLNTLVFTRAGPGGLYNVIQQITCQDAFHACFCRDTTFFLRLNRLVAKDVCCVKFMLYFAVEFLHQVSQP
jgi:hypothetical protein